MNDDVNLSRLLDGDLTPPEAAALRARLAADPALAARFAALQRTVSALQGLERELVPPGIPRALQAAKPPVRRHVPLLTYVGLPMMLAAGLLFALRSPPARTVLLSGETVVDGQVELIAGGLPVTIDGRVRVIVEPPAAGVRESGAEIISMDRSHLLAALGGAVITVTVYEGTATWTPSAEAPARVVAVGESQSVQVPGGPAGGGAGSGATSAPRPASLPEALARIDTLERQLAGARLQAGINAGIVQTHEGVAQPWPKDVPAPFRPEAFRRHLDAALEASPGASVVEVDCDEFPCIAVLTTSAPGADWVSGLEAVHERMNADGTFGDVGVMGLAAATDDGEDARRYYAFAMAPGPVSEEGRARTGFRGKALVDELTHEGQEDREALEVMGYLSPTGEE
ncbi:hypothetical protein LBMAG42_01950 [Deltaproteobacteria bacterium]|nr:hypothetical protein LBMAG42_01950 [Deltaproteobacteria bacterium]